MILLLYFLTYKVEPSRLLLFIDNKNSCNLFGINILDVYPTNIKTWKGRKNAMDVEEVIQKIYDFLEISIL